MKKKKGQISFPQKKQKTHKKNANQARFRSSNSGQLAALALSDNMGLLTQPDTPHATELDVGDNLDNRDRSLDRSFDSQDRGRGANVL